MRKFIRAIDLPPPEHCGPEWPWPLKIVTFGGFQLFKDGEPLPQSRKTPRRLFNVLKAIAAYGGKDVAEEKIIDAVWPDEDGDCARQSFDVAIHRLRKLLGDSHAIAVKNGKIGFDETHCFLDIKAFQSGIAARQLARALDLYSGDFLGQDEDLPCVLPLRRKLRAQFLSAVETHAAELASRGDNASAEAAYRAGVAACPEAEPFYQGLMRCCMASGRAETAIEAYRRLCAILAAAGQTPSAATMAQFHSLHV